MEFGKIGGIKQKFVEGATTRHNAAFLDVHPSASDGGRAA